MTQDQFDNVLGFVGLLSVIAIGFAVSWALYGG